MVWQILEVSTAKSGSGRPTTRTAVLASLVLFALALGPIMGGAVAFASREATAGTLAVGVAYGMWGIRLSDRGAPFPSRWLGSETAVDLAVATLFVGAFAPFLAVLPSVSAIFYSLWVLGGIAKLCSGAVAPTTPLLFLPGLLSLWMRSGLEQSLNVALVYLAIPLVVAVTALAVTRLRTARLAHNAHAAKQDFTIRASSSHRSDQVLIALDAA